MASHEPRPASDDLVVNAAGAPMRRSSSRLQRRTSQLQAHRDATGFDVENEQHQARPQRRPSALGDHMRPAPRNQSFLQRIGLQTGDEAGSKAPARSPTGAIRHVSGLNVRAPLREDSKLKKGTGAAFTEVEVEDEGEQWHTLDLPVLFEKLESSEIGLTSEQAAAGLAKHGLNQITPPKQTHWIIKFLISLVTGFQLMMNVGAILCFIVYGITKGGDSQTLALGVMLLLVVFLTSGFQTYQEGKADNIMVELRRLVADAVWVYRNGDLVQVPAEQLTLGDIVQVKAGEKVPADLRILTATDLKVNNAALTGENVDIKLGPMANHKRLFEAKNIARSGCSFTSGHGTAVVFAVGDNTFFGQIAKSTITIERPETLMKQELERLIKFLSIFAICLGILFCILAIFFGFSWVEAVAFGIGIIVANVPEGLLSQLVVTLAITAKQLQKRDVLVTNLEIIETLGAVSVICSDKTGTLTANRMTVSHVVYDGAIHTTEHTSNLDTDTFALVDAGDAAFQELQRVITLNTDAFFTQTADEQPEVLKREAKGDASETALIKFAQPYRDIVEFRKANNRLAAIPFNSTNKWMLSVVAHEKAGQPVQVLVKGAPERVFAMCTTARMNGEIVDITAEVKAHFESLNETLGSRGERVLGFAVRELTEPCYDDKFEYDTDSEIPNFPTGGLTFVGYVSLIDPPRPGVKDAVVLCQRAGIKIYMVTGDHPVTALAIARNIGLTSQPTANELRARGEPVPDDYRGCIAVHGTEMLQFTQDDWDHVLAHDEIVFARTMPQQKQDIVSQLHKLDMVVAMTGDGVNDAPALKAANVGVAMGSGASVAKEAAQIVLMKDDFGAIVEGISQGRQVFGSLKKVIVYVLISNVPEILPFLLFVAAKIPLAIETIVILFIDLGTDIFPAIAMAYESEESELMAKPPRTLNDHLVSVKMMAVSYFTVGLMTTFVAYFGFFYVLLDRGFSWGNIFGMGLGFRDEYDDLDGDRKEHLTRVCLENDEYLRNRDATDPRTCTYDFERYRKDTLSQAQAAFFIAVVWGQIANILCRKTFTESILNVHRLTNNRVLIWAIIFELVLALCLIYVPGLNDLFLMGAISAKYLFCTIWYIPLMIMYEEARKWCVRRWPGGCVAMVTMF